MSTPRTGLGLMLAVAAGLSLVLSFATPARAVTVIMATDSRTWSPHRVSISTGTSVRWANPSTNAISHRLKSYGHNWSFGPFDMPPGTSFHHRFNSTGTFFFRCTIHSTLLNGVCSGMCGKVHVT